MKDADLALALDLHRKGYELLRWMAEKVDRAALSFDLAHDALSIPEAAADWVRRNYSVIPVRCRPERADLVAFGNLVGSYLATSFELVKAPGRRLTSTCGCWCGWCGMMARASHLRVKRLTRGDKKRARDLAVEAVLRHALQLRREISYEDAKAMSERSDDSALVAYGVELVRRMNGHYEGPAVLALWRRFAWSKTGSPKKNFRLTVDLIRRAEDRLGEALAAN